MLALALVLFLAASSSSSADIRVADFSLSTKSFDISETKSLGGNDRGPAIAVLSDGTLLLGGGSRGGSIFSWREDQGELKLLGEMMNRKERIRDSRFAITDIAVLSEGKDVAELLISIQDSQARAVLKS